jgi:hypothetical protein
MTMKGVSNVDDRVDKQVYRFKEAARVLECGDDEARLGAKLKKVAKPKVQTKDSVDAK